MWRGFWGVATLVCLLFVLKMGIAGRVGWWWCKALCGVVDTRMMMVMVL